MNHKRKGIRKHDWEKSDAYKDRQGRYNLRHKLQAVFFGGSIDEQHWYKIKNASILYKISDMNDKLLDPYYGRCKGSLYSKAVINKIK